MPQGTFPLETGAAAQIQMHDAGAFLRPQRRCVFRRGGSEDRDHRHANLGVVYQTRGELGRAKDYHYRALRIYEDLGENVEAMANTYSNLGRLYKSLGNLTRSEALFLDALKLRQGLESSNARKINVGFRTDTY